MSNFWPTSRYTLRYTGKGVGGSRCIWYAPISRQPAFGEVSQARCGGVRLGSQSIPHTDACEHRTEIAQNLESTPQCAARGLKMPGALEAFDDILAWLDGGTLARHPAPVSSTHKGGCRDLTARPPPRQSVQFDPMKVFNFEPVLTRVSLPPGETLQGSKARSTCHA